jgi:WD40 repeat protein
VASGGTDGKIYQWIQVWRLFSSEQPLALEVGPMSAVVPSDHDHFLVGGPDGMVQRCDRTAVPMACETVATELGRINSLALSHDGQLLASANEKGTIILQSLDGSRQVHSLSAGTNVTSLTFSADDQRIIAGVDAPLEVGGIPSKSQIKMWDLSALPETPMAISLVDDPTKVESLDAEPVGVIRSLIIDRKGERVAIAAGGNGITWALGSNTPVTQLTGRARKTRSLAFSPDGSQLASGRSDGWIYLWQTENDPTQTAAPIGRLKAPIIALVWRDEKTLIAVAADGLMIEFSLEPGFMKSKACEVAVRDFTADESRRFFGKDDYKVCS